MKIFNNKKKIIILGSCILVLIVALLIITILPSLSKTESELVDITKDTQLDGLYFTDPMLLEENGIYEYNVEVENTNKSDYQLNYVKFTLYNEDKEEIVTLIGFAGEKLKPNEKKTISANVDMDIRNAKFVKINIEK